MTHSILKKVKWEIVFVVLSNVGLLFFDKKIEKPTELIPILNSHIEFIHPSQVEGCTTVFSFTIPKRRLVFRCYSLS